MKKSFNKFLSVLLIFAMLTPVFPTLSLAADAAETVVSLGSGGLYGGSGLKITQTGGIGGKNADDISGAFVLGSEAASTSRRYQYDISGYVEGTDEYTYEFNMYADGDAIAWMCYSSGYTLLRWEADGTLWYDNNGTLTEWGKLARGQWHRVAISYRKGQRFVFYVDGVLVSNSSNFTNDPKIIGFGYYSGSSNGIVAYDDMIKYDELYTNHHKIPYYTAPSISLKGATDLTDGNVINYDDELITTSVELLNCITAGDTDTVKLYKGSNLLTQITNDIPLTGSEYVVVESADKAYSYYSISGGYKVPKAELKSNNARVVVDEDNMYIYVYTHPSPTASATYKVSSQTLIDSLTSETHSTIRYLNTGYEEVSSKLVYDGYIVLTDSESDTAYFTVKSNTDNIFEEDFTISRFSSTGYLRRFDKESEVTYDISEAGIQKENNDTSFAIHGNGETDIYPSGAGYAAWLQKEDPGINLDSVYTIEYSFLNRSTASAYSTVYWKRTNGSTVADERLFSLHSDGSAYGYNDKPIGNLNTDEWHTVSLTYDYGRTRVLVFVDGVLINEDAWTGADGGIIDYIKFGMAGEDGNPAYGTIYYDDVSIYGGYPRGDKHTPSLISDKFYIDRASKVIYGAIDRDSEEVLADIASELNGTVSIDTDTVTTDTVLTQSITGIDRLQYTYEYTFSDQSYISSPSVTNTGIGTDDEVNVRITVCPKDENGFDGQSLMLASYNGNTLTGVQLINNDASFKKVYDVTLASDREANVTTKCFIWDKNLSPLYGEDLTAHIVRPTMISTDDEYQKAMTDFICVHKRSGLLTAYGKKYILNDKPYTENSVLYIPQKEVAEILGVSLKSNAAKYVSAEEFFGDVMNLTVTELDSEYNGGAVIAGNKSFDISSVESTQQLNDFLFSYRPTAEEILSRYNSSSLKGQHPRMFLSPSDVERIKAQCETNEYMKKWKDHLIASCKWNSSLPPVEYVIDEGGRLLSQSRKVLSYMHTFGMSYLLTGDVKYAQYAFVQLEAAAKFPDWNPNHALDTAEMAAAFAVGYDWMYDGFTEEQRKFIEDAFYRLGIAAANNLYEGIAGRTSAVDCDSNWNAVVNGGLATGALAFMDVYPQSSSRIVAYAIDGLGRLLWRFAPVGAWFEGPGYWEYTVKYMTKLLSNSERILGTEFGLTSCEGFDLTVDSILHMQSLNGTYAYGNCMASTVLYVPEIFWISHILDKPEYASTVLKIKDGSFPNDEDIALALCWYDTSMVSGAVEMDKDIYIPVEEVVAMRSGWTKDDSYLALSGGYTGDNNSHLDTGSFVFDLNGVRWSHDPGQANYNNPVYEHGDTKPGGEKWKIFRIRAEDHSTLFINPTTNEDHRLDTFAPIERFETNNNSGITVVNMTDTLSDNASSAKRGFALCNNKTALVIRDEVTLSDKSKSNDVYWSMITKADVQINPDGKGAVLSQDGEMLYLNFAENGADSSHISVAPAAPLDNTGVIYSDSGDSAYNRILIELTSSDKVNLTVSLSAEDGTELIGRYNTALSGWTLE